MSQNNPDRRKPRFREMVVAGGAASMGLAVIGLFSMYSINEYERYQMHVPEAYGTVNAHKASILATPAADGQFGPDIKQLYHDNYLIYGTATLKPEVKAAATALVEDYQN